MTKVLESDLFVEEFLIEAEEFLESAEQKLIELDKGSSLNSVYDVIFRSFHSLKGAAGMLGLDQLQSQVHLLETHFQSCKNETIFSRQKVSYFLDGIDCCRSILKKQKCNFDSDFSKVESIQVTDSKEDTNVTSLDPSKKDETIIYVVDDEPDIVEILEAMISDAGFVVKAFTDPLLAVASLKKVPPHTVFTDMTMPGLNGLGVLEKVHSFNSEIPVIFVSGNLTKQDLIQSLSFGVFAAVEKPFKEQQILSVCRAATQRFKLWNLLNRSINFVLYQFSALEDYLEKTNQSEVRKLMVKEMEELLDVRRQLKSELEKKI